MAKNVIACRPGDRVAHAETLMIRYQIRRLPVVDANRRLVGLLSLSDLARATQLRPEADEDVVTPDEIEATLAAVSVPRLLHPC